tara:strand:- start:282 stop:641 length:360 start_codon:yes stop_codon:yes gene_type:complete
LVLVELLVVLIINRVLVMPLVYLEYPQLVEVVVLLVLFHHHKVIMEAVEAQVEELQTLIMSVQVEVLVLLTKVTEAVLMVVVIYKHLVAVVELVVLVLLQLNKLVQEEMVSHLISQEVQ